MLALDTETALIRPGCLAPALTCISTHHDTFGTELHHVADLTPGDVLMWISSPVVGHNIAYDMAVLCAEWPELIPDVFRAYDNDWITDTMIRQRLIDIANGELDGRSIEYTAKDGTLKTRFVRNGYSLADLYSRHGFGDLPKPAVRQQYGELRNVPLSGWTEEAISYARDDAKATWRVWDAQEAAVKADGRDLLADQHRQARAAFALHLASCWGMVTDARAIEKLEGTTREAYERARAIVMDAGILRPNGTRDTKAAKALMLEACAREGVEPKRTDTFDPADEKAADPLWGVSLDEEACLASGDATLKAYSELSSLMTIVDTHIPALRNGLKAPIQPRFNVLVDTGRTSCYGHDSKNPEPSSYGYQVQNIRRLPGIRECFVARPGHVFICADYSALELHTWAQVCIWAVGASALAEALNANMDPHLILAGSIVGCDYDTAKTRYKADDQEIAGPEGARQFAKIGNFGFMGGMGVPTFRKWARVAYGVNFDEGFATQLRDTWKDTWPESRSYFDWVSSHDGIDDGRAYVEHFMSGRHRGPLRFTVTANTYFQGLGADAAKAALWAATRECWTGGQLSGARVVNFVHDEIVIETPEELAHKHAEALSSIMVEEAYKWLPDVKPKVEAVVTRRLSKKAKQVRDAQGRLVPWDW